MMHRPGSLALYASIMFAVAFSFYAQIALLQNLSIFWVMEITRNITHLNFLVIVLCLLSGFLAMQASGLLYWISPLVTCAVILNNVNAGTIGDDYSLIFTTAASFAFLLTQGILLNPTALKVVQDKRLQWWKVPARRPISIPIRISSPTDVFSARSFDVSTNGVFVTGLRKISDQSSSEFAQHFRPEDTVELAIYQDGRKSLTCRGRVARIERNRGRYPTGMAIQFKSRGIRERLYLRSFLRSINSSQS